MFTVERYRKTRFWAVYDAGELVCVTVYKKGANAVKTRLESVHVKVVAAEARQDLMLSNGR
jgi:hypothetical protein